MSLTGSSCSNEWIKLPSVREEGSLSSMFQVSNPKFPVPKGMKNIPDFVSVDDASLILKQLDENRWTLEGFAHKRKVQRYSVLIGNVPERLAKLVDRFREVTGRQPQHVLVEEYPPKPQREVASTEFVVTKFESVSQCSTCNDDACHCFVALLPLSSPVVQHLNCPQVRSPECWELQSAEHFTDVWMEPRTMFVKWDECLWDWRCRISPARDCKDTDRVVVLKFYSLPQNPSTALSLSREDSLASLTEEPEENGSADPKVVSEANAKGPMPPMMQDMLTIIVTTSPIKSNPSTELLERTFDSFQFAGPDFCYKCRKVVVCDGCRMMDDEGVSRKHSTVRQALRNGIATREQVENYALFKKALRQLCREATKDSPFHNTVVEELDSRHGYGFALRHALRHCVTTPYVCVIQHDRTFMRPTPLHAVLHAMWNNPVIKYVGMSMRSNVSYLDGVLSKYGKRAHEDLAELILRPPELALDAEVYGPNGSSVRSTTSYTSPKVQLSIKQIQEAYKSTSHATLQNEWVKVNPPEPGKHQLSLIPTLFWFDNTHICETAHYRDFIFDPTYKFVARGGFVEDKLSPKILRSVERQGVADGHARYGCFLLDDHSGRFFTGHLDGGTYQTKETRREFQSRDDAISSYP